MRNICVFCASSNFVSQKYVAVAEELGKEIALRNCVLVYGGGKIGLMGKMAVATQKFGGKVIGVIPKVIRDKEIAFEECDTLIETVDLRERKAKLEHFADAFVVLAGGFGTLDEVLEIITLKQLKLHQKPIIFINTDNFFENLFLQFEKMFVEEFTHFEFKNLYFSAKNVSEMFEYLKNYQPFDFEGKKLWKI